MLKEQLDKMKHITRMSTIDTGGRKAISEKKSNVTTTEQKLANYWSQKFSEMPIESTDGETQNTKKAWIDFMQCIYADKIKDEVNLEDQSTKKASYRKSTDKYPLGGEIASDKQFQAIEALFNTFYKWYVPKKVLIQKIPTNKMEDSMSPEKRYQKAGGDTQFDLHVNRIINMGLDQFLQEQRNRWIA